MTHRPGSDAVSMWPAMRGFTLIELMVTLALLGILAMVAVPSFKDAFLGNKLASFSNTFMASALVARSEAIKRNAPVKMCRSSNGSSCAASGGWEQGWIVFADTNDDGDVDANETRLQYQQALDDGFSFTGDQYNLAFQPTGLSVTQASLTLCRRSPSPGPQERSISIGVNGRVTIGKTTTGTCS